MTLSITFLSLQTPSVGNKERLIRRRRRKGSKEEAEEEEKRRE